MYCLYLHIRKKDNIVFYIGIGNNKRPYIKNTRSIFWKNEISKHEYFIQILSSNLTWENAQEAEIQLIRIYGRRDLCIGTLVNLTDGGDGSPGCIQTKEHKLKISNSLKGKNKGENNPMYGKNPYKDKIHYASRKIINTETFEIFNTISSVLNIINLPKTTFLRWLNNKKLNKTKFIYYNE